MPPRSTRIRLAGIAVAFAIAGCTSHDIVTTTTRPGKFRLYGCDQLNQRATELAKRERELDGLMLKARQGPAGEVAVAVAYQNEYNLTQSDLREIELAGAEKKCVLKYRSVSERAVR